MSNEMKSSLLALLPKGPFWKPKIGGDFDKLFDGMGENAQEIYEFLTSLKVVKDPYETEQLDDLEREYGIVTNTTKTDLERRTALAQKVFATRRNGSVTDLQEALDSAGFNLTVHENYPLIDPRPYGDLEFQTIAGEALAQAGELDAIAGQYGFGEIIANGTFYDSQVPNYTIFAGEVLVQAGEPEALAGFFDAVNKTKYDDYEITSNPYQWWFTFFVAGSFTGWSNLLNDWNMNKQNVVDWTPGAYTQLSKIAGTTDRLLQVLPLTNPDQQLASLPVNVEDSSIIFRHRIHDPGDTEIQDLAYNYDGISVGSPVNIFTKFGRGMTFDGIDDWIALGALPLATDTVFTLNAIVNITGTGTGGGVISRRGNLASSVHFYLSIAVADDKVSYYDGVTFTKIATPLTPGTYYYIGAVINGANSFLWQVDLSSGTVTYSATFTPVVNLQSVTTEIGAYDSGTQFNFGGDILFTEAYSEAKDTTWIVNEATRIRQGLVAEFADFRENKISDGYMETPALVHWLAVRNAVVTKQAIGTAYDGLQFLRVLWGGTSNPMAIQEIDSILNYGYEISCRVRSNDGIAVPEVFITDSVGGSASSEWTGTNSTSWQYVYFKWTYTVTGTNYIALSMTSGAGAGVEYDYLSIKIVPKLVEPWNAQQLTDSTGNVDGVSEFTDNAYNQFGKGRELALESATPNLLDSEVPADNLNTTDDFGLSCWIKTTATDIILFSGRNNSLTRFEYGINSSGIQYFYNGTTTYTGTESVNTGRWVHCAFGMSGLTSRFFTNGVQDAGSHFIAITNSISETVKIASNIIDQSGVLVGKIAIPRIYTQALTVTPNLAQYTADLAVILNGSYAEQILDNPISGYYISSVELLIDSDMEAPGINWNSINSAILTKDTTNPYAGLQCLRITRIGAYGACSYSGTPMTMGRPYRITGWARGDGTTYPAVWSGSTLWTGTSSTSWQQYVLEVISTNVNLYLYKQGAPGSYVEFDNVSIKEISQSTTVSAKAETPLLDVNVPAIFGYNPVLNTWEEIVFGDGRTTEVISGEALNGISRIRLYDKFASNVSADFWYALLEEQSIQAGQVKFNRLDELRTIILDKKPLHSWCALIAEHI